MARMLVCISRKSFVRWRAIRWQLRILVILTGFCFLCGCGGGGGQPGRVIRVWSHQGQEAENKAMHEMAEAFNQAHKEEGTMVRVVFFPDYQYAEKVATAAAAGDLPDVLDLDGPAVAQFVEAGLLAPLDKWIGREEKQDFLNTIIEQGTIDGKLYALGAFDSAVVLYYDKSMLERAGVSPPGEGESWSWNEFTESCEKLESAGMDPVALHMNESADEWYTYAFSPVIWSGGGALISEDGERVKGILDSAVNINSLESWQRLFAEDFAARDPVDPNPFGAGKTAMDWTGHWMARLHQSAKGDDLGVMPLPALGKEPAAPCGSWCWGMSANADNPDLSMEWIRWVTGAKTGIAPMVRANGAVPARESAFELFPEYSKYPYRIFRRLLRESGHPRPRTPHYPALTQHFSAALRDIAHGADVEERLESAADKIQRIIDRDMRR